MVSGVQGDSSKICLPAAKEVILRKRDSYARQMRSERGRDKKISTVGKKSNSQIVRRQIKKTDQSQHEKACKCDGS